MTFEDLANRLVEVKTVHRGAITFTFERTGERITVTVSAPAALDDSIDSYKDLSAFVSALKRGMHWGAWQGSSFGKSEGFYPELLSQM